MTFLERESMTLLKQGPRAVVTRLRAVALMAAAAAALLAGCETTGSGTPVAVEAAKPPDPPMTHARAASECWMQTKQVPLGTDLDKRADIVNKCIDEKKRRRPPVPWSRLRRPLRPTPKRRNRPPPPHPRKKQPASPTAGEPDKKPADADPADKKP